MRLHLLLLGLVSLLSGCGGSSPLAPSPVASPQPTFPSLIGGWVGTYTSNINIPNVSGGSGSGGCSISWIVTNQTAGQFSGTWQLTGGFGQATGCGSSGNLSGAVTSSGAITNLSFATSVGPLPVCASLSSTGYSGTATATSVNASATERWSCTSGSITVVADVGRVLALTKR